MKLTYDAEADVLMLSLVPYQDFKARLFRDVEGSGGMVCSVDQDGNVLGINIYDASRRYPAEAIASVPSELYDEPIPLADAAHQLGVEAQTLRKAIERGRLKGKKIGRIWTTTISALDEYEASRLHAGPGSAGKSSA